MRSEHSLERSNLRQSEELLLAQYLKTCQAGFVERNARDFNIAEKEFSGNLLHGQAVCAKVQQFGRKLSELADLRRPTRDPANGDLYRLFRNVMQGTFVAEPAHNLLIIRRKLDDIDFRPQMQAAFREKQLIAVLGDLQRGLTAGFRLILW